MRRRRSGWSSWRGAFWHCRAWVFPRRCLQEFYVNATRKQALRLSAEEALAILSSMRGFPILPVTEDLVFAAIGVKVRYQILYWDAAIIAAAEAFGAREFYSEDMNDGQTYGPVRVVNSFKQPARHDRRRTARPDESLRDGLERSGRNPRRRTAGAGAGDGDAGPAAGL